MLLNVSERWLILAVLFLARTAMGFQFQAVAALSSSVIADFSIDYTQLGLLIGLYLFPGIVIAYPGGLLGQYFGDKRIAVFGMALSFASQKPPDASPPRRGWRSPVRRKLTTLDSGSRASAVNSVTVAAFLIAASKRAGR